MRHAVTGLEYEAARAAAFVGYQLICEWENVSIAQDGDSNIPRYTDPRWRGYLSNIKPSEFRAKYESRLPEMISGEAILSWEKTHPDCFTTIRPEVKYRVRACTRYAIEENLRIELFVELGAKITGGGAGGTVAVLGSRSAEGVFRKVVDQFGKARNFEPYVFEGSSIGADRFGVRVLGERG